MADITVTTTQVLPDATGEIVTGPAAGAIEAGDPVYFNATNQNWAQADASALATLSSGKNVGIAVSTANVATQKLSVQVTGSPTIGAGASLVEGETYAVSATAGKMVAIVEVVNPNFACILGVANASNGIDMNASGVLTATTARAA